MKKPVLLDNKGFSLIELLFSLVVFAVGILAMAHLQGSSMQFDTDARLISQAVMLAESKVDELMTLSYGSTFLQDGTGANDGDAGLDDTGADADHSEASSLPGAVHTIYWNISTGNPRADTKTVRVIVTWTDQRGNAKSHSADFIKADEI